MHLELRVLGDKYVEIAKRRGTLSIVDQLFVSIDLLYRAGVMAVPIPPEFKVSQVEVYDKSKDPLEHLKMFKAHMILYDFLREIACQDFPLIVTRAAQAWFASLLPETIDSFYELALIFMT